MNYSSPVSVMTSPTSERQTLVHNLKQCQPLQALEERGTKLWRAFPDLVSDVSIFFHFPDASLKQENEIAHGYRFNWLVMKYLGESGEYRMLRERSGLDPWMSVSAAEAFVGRLIEHLGAPSDNGTKRHEERWKGAAKVVKTKGICLMEKAIAGQDIGIELNEAILAIAKEVEGNVAATNLLTDICWQWGVDRGAVQKMDYNESIRLGKRMKDNEALRRLAEMVGRFRSLALLKKATAIADLPYEIYDVTQGNDLTMLLPAEKMNLVHPVLRYEFYRKLIDKKLFLYDVSGEEEAGKGSIVACIDTSGSMAGEREVVAKAIAIGLLEIARVEKRNYAAILFSSKDEVVSFNFGRDGVTMQEKGDTRTLDFIQGLLEMAAWFFGGGTDYEAPLRRAMQVIGNDPVQYADADIVFITDDYCEVSDSFLTEYQDLKRQKRFYSTGVIIGAGADNARTMKKFCDEVISSSELTEEIAGRIFESV